MSSFDNRSGNDDNWDNWPELPALPKTAPRLPRLDDTSWAGENWQRGGAQQPPTPPQRTRPRRPSPPQRPQPQPWGTSEDDLDQWDTALLPALQVGHMVTDAMPVYSATAKIRKPPIERRRPGAVSQKPADEDGLPTWIMPVVSADVEAQTTMRLPVVVPAAKSYMQLVKQLLTSSGIYAIASLTTPLIALVLAPFLTHNLSQAEYGTLAICNTIVSLVAGISQLGMGSAFFRAFGYDFTSPEGRRSVVGTVVIVLTVGSAVVLGIAAMWPRPIAQILLNDPSKAPLITILSIVILIQNFSIPGVAWMRAANRPAAYSVLAVGNLLIALAANFYFVGYAQMGIKGALIATGCGYGFISLIMFPVSIVYSRLRIRWDIAWSLLTFGVPQVLGFVSGWILSLSDRYLLTIFGTLDEVAKYAVAYNLGMVISAVVIAPFQMAWPTAMYAIAKRPDAQQVYKIVFRWFGYVLLLAAFGLAVCTTALLSWLFPASYRSAAPVIPVVGFSLAIYGVYIMFMSGANIRRKTWMGSTFVAVAALVNFGANVVLIPHYGAFGAAASTLVAYIVLATISYIGVQIVYPVPYEVGRFLIAAVSGIALYIAVGIASTHTGIIGGVGIGAVGFIIYTGLLALLGGANVRAIRAKVRPTKKPSNQPAGRPAGKTPAGRNY